LKQWRNLRPQLSTLNPQPIWWFVFRRPGSTPARPPAQAAKISHLNLLPQGKAGKDRRVLNRVRQIDKEGFGNCTVTGSCEAVCPKEISLSFIAKMNRDYGVAILKGR
jgi:NAD-dependent dihydropyrimidine dehydrogenase PreA subunit